ncbi:MAG: hypothetical protein AABX88_00985 [Nanoarchaeota archaeon]
MLTRKEITSILVATLVIAFAITLVETPKIFLYGLFLVLLVIMINVLAKKITSYYLDSEIEIKLWEIKRYGFVKHRYLEKPIPIGAFFPLISKVFLFPFNSFVWMASLVFDVKAKVYRSAKRHGLYNFSEMTESHIGLIAAAGILVNLFFAIVGYLINFPEFAKLNIYFALFNLIPLSDLDGNKILFGNLVLWSFLAALTLAGFFISIFVV